MKFTLLSVAIVFSASMYGLVYAKDMVLTTLEGTDLLLKDDSTWVYKGGKEIEVTEDFTVPVDGGRFVLIATDGTWGFVRKEVKKERELIPGDSIVARGTGVHIDLAAATAMAQKSSLSQAVTKMKYELRNVKTDPKKLTDCVKRVEKEVDKNEAFNKSTGWTVTIVLKLDRGSILAVAECAMKDPVKPPDSAAKK